MTMGGEQAIIDCDTTKGPFTMRFYHDWSPNGYDRAVDLYEKVCRIFCDEAFCCMR